MILNHSNISCGIQELYDLGAVTKGKFADFVASMWRQSSLRWDSNKRDGRIQVDLRAKGKGYVILFSDNTYGRGKDIAKWIEELEVGEVAPVKPEFWKNPNMEGTTSINLWVWTYNGQLPKGYTKEPKARKKKSTSAEDSAEAA